MYFSSNLSHSETCYIRRSCMFQDDILH